MPALKGFTPMNGNTTRSPLQDRTNMLISPFGMSPKAMVKKTPVKTFSLEQEEDDEGYASAQSDSVDHLLNGNWKPNFDIDMEEDEGENLIPSANVALTPTVARSMPEQLVAMEPTIISREQPCDLGAMVGERKEKKEEATLKQAFVEEKAQVEAQVSGKTFSESEVEAMREAWMREVALERVQWETKVAKEESALAALRVKEAEYISLITEYESAVTKMEKEKAVRDATNLEAYAEKLSEIELANTRLRTEKAEVEASFQQLHKRYEQLKGLQANAIKNEGVLKQTLGKSQSDLMSSEARFLRLKTHAQAQLDAANAEINRIRDESLKKNLLLAAKLSLAQTQLASLSVEHALSKTENSTLQNIISELCQQVSS